MWYEWLNKSDPHAFYESSKSLFKWSASGKLLNMFLKLKSEKSTFIEVNNSEMEVLKSLKSKIRTIPISNSGHFMMLDNPQEFYQKLINFIESDQTL